jgi:hypothetical protein
MKFGQLAKLFTMFKSSPTQSLEIFGALDLTFS